MTKPSQIELTPGLTDPPLPHPASVRLGIAMAFSLCAVVIAGGWGTRWWLPPFLVFQGCIFAEWAMNSCAQVERAARNE